MAKRNTETQRKKDAAADSSPAPTADAVEPLVVAFAEHLGRIAGTLQGRAEAWMDRDALTKQIATVRDGAADLLARLAGGVARAEKEKPAAAAARAKGRSGGGGVVDARGKKHRRPPPADPGAAVAHSQAAKMRTAMPMEKTSRRRGRG